MSNTASGVDRHRWFGWNLQQWADPSIVGADAKQAGVAGTTGFDRLDCAWGYIAKNANTDDWSWLDARVGAVVAAGRQPLLTLEGWNPGFTGAKADHYFANDDGIVSEFGAFCGRAVARYKPVVKRWELGCNEGNLGGFFLPRVDPLVAAKYVLAAGHAVKSQPHDGKTISPGLANASSNGQNEAPYDFFVQLWPRVKDVCDLVGMHIYQHAGDDGQSWSPSLALRKMHALSARPAMLTEVNTNNGDSTSVRAAEAPKLLTLLASYDFVRGINWYKMSGDDTGFVCGALDAQRHPRPVYTAIEKWAAA